MDKPTLDQIAWVIKCQMQNWREGGSYRHLLEIMGVDGQPGAYEKVLPAMEINNCLLADLAKRIIEEADNGKQG